jgi:hypothetical protein
MAVAERHIPFLFVSAYGKSALPPGRSDWKVCAKPFVINDLVQMLLTVMLDANKGAIDCEQERLKWRDGGFAAAL